MLPGCLVVCVYHVRQTLHSILYELFIAMMGTGLQIRVSKHLRMITQTVNPARLNCERGRALRASRFRRALFAR